MGKRKQYSEKFKKDAVRLVQSRGTRTVDDVAAGLGVSPSMLHRWQKRYAASEGDIPSAQEDREEVERLRRRLREVEQENAFLKKCAALFAKDVK